MGLDGGVHGGLDRRMCSSAAAGLVPGLGRRPIHPAELGHCAGPPHQVNPPSLINHPNCTQPPATHLAQVLGEVGALPDVFTELEINFFLLRRLLGVRTSGDEKQGKVRWAAGRKQTQHVEWVVGWGRARVLCYGTAANTEQPAL